VFRVSDIRYRTMHGIVYRRTLTVRGAGIVMPAKDNSPVTVNDDAYPPR
jgi:hypothetical protein